MRIFVDCSQTLLKSNVLKKPVFHEELFTLNKWISKYRLEGLRKEARFYKYFEMFNYTLSLSDITK